MSRDPVAEEPEPPEPGDPDQGRLATTRPQTLGTLVLVGLVVGWALRLVSVQLDRTPPRVGVVQVGVLVLVAAILFGVAFLTHRDVHRRGAVARDPLPAHHAVNRLVLAKACALAGALMTGAFLGSALSWLGIDAETAPERIVTSLLAALAAALVVTGSVLLERACRIPGASDEP